MVPLENWDEHFLSTPYPFNPDLIVSGSIPASTNNQPPGDRGMASNEQLYNQFMKH